MMAPSSVAHALGLVNGYGAPVLLVLVVIASAGAPLPVSLLFVALGALSVHSAGPSFAGTAALGITGSVLGDLADFEVGRLSTFWLARHLRRGRRAINDAARRLEGGAAGSNFNIAILLTRFALTPLATPVSLVAGASGLRLPRFLAWDAAGESIYILGNLALGRVFGPRLTTISPAALAYWAFCLALALIPVVLYRVAGTWRAHRARPRALSPLPTRPTESGLT